MRFIAVLKHSLPLRRPFLHLNWMRIFSIRRRIRHKDIFCEKSIFTFFSRNVNYAKMTFNIAARRLPLINLQKKRTFWYIFITLRLMYFFCKCKYYWKGKLVSRNSIFRSQNQKWNPKLSSKNEAQNDSNWMSAKVALRLVSNTILNASTLFESE